MTEKLFNVGKMINTHGIKGEIKVKRISDFPERFTVGNILYMEHNAELLELEIDGHRLHKGFDLLHFAGYDNINDVVKFKNNVLKINQSQQTELKENEFYYHEIIGCHVYTTDDSYLGVISEILAPGANDVWVVKQTGKQDILLPYIDDVIKDVDVSERKIKVELLEGLVE